MTCRASMRMLVIPLLLGLGGCVIPRTAELACLGTVNSPLPPGGRQVAFVIDPHLIEHYPEVTVDIATAQSRSKAGRFYCAELARRGWHEMEHHEYGTPPTSEGWWFVLGDARLRLIIEDAKPEQPSLPEQTRVSITIETRHVWDWPSRLIQMQIALCCDSTGFGSGSDLGRFLSGWP